ncbi:unnamed protein product, partial [Musa acuminata var. zebrina]
MASTFVAATEAGKEQQHQHHGREGGNGPPSPPPATKCVCAPATHAGSFECSLHRVNSHGRSAAPPMASPNHQPP